MKAPEILYRLDTPDRRWITRGPDSGGVSGYLLWKGHVFRYEDWGSGSEIDDGIPVGEFIEKNRSAPKCRRVIAELLASN